MHIFRLTYDIDHLFVRSEVLGEGSWVVIPITAVPQTAVFCGEERIGKTGSDMSCFRYFSCECQ